MDVKKKTVICGIGNRLRGDDAIGPLVIDELKRQNTIEDKKNIMLLDCQSSPESFAGKIISFNPDKIIITDAVEMNKEPGSIEQIPTEKIKSHLATTHKMPITMLIHHIQNSIPETEIIFIGVQQKQTGFGMEMSHECLNAVKEAAEYVLKMV